MEGGPLFGIHGICASEFNAINHLGQQPLGIGMEVGEHECGWRQGLRVRRQRIAGACGTDRSVHCGAPVDEKCAAARRCAPVAMTSSTSTQR